MVFPFPFIFGHFSLSLERKREAKDKRKRRENKIDDLGFSRCDSWAFLSTFLRPKKNPGQSCFPKDHNYISTRPFAKQRPHDKELETGLL